MEGFNIFYDFSINPYGLAPMAGVTDKAMRLLCRQYGCGLQYTEMVSAKALLYNNHKTFELFDLVDEEAPVIVQLFGSEPAVMAEGAAIAVAHGAKALDVNMGCPVPKVANHGEGSGLLKTPQVAWEIIRAMTKAVEVPVSVKIRIGWDVVDEQIADFAKGLEDAGAALLAVHGRTRAQYYSGKANWQVIGDIVKAVDIPVLANGDVVDVSSARAILAETGARGVLIGRGALGNPWLFESLLADWQGKPAPLAPSFEEKAQVMLTHATLACQYKGEAIAMREMRKQIGWYVKGMPHAAEWRRASSMLSTLAELRALLSTGGYLQDKHA